MRKDYQKAARGSIYAIAVMIAGMCFSASPAQSSTCFLPSGNCVTGKIDTKQDGGNETIEYCNGYDISESEYNKKYNNTSCFSCGSPCTRTSGGTFYKCETVNNTKWYDDYNVCCTNGTKYDKDDGKCCAGGKCDHPCSGGKQWSPTLKQCVCPSNVETDGNGNCCASGQVLDENKNCTTPCTMNDCGSYPYTTDPGNSEKCNLGCNKGTRYKCKSGYTYSGGKCVEQCAASGYTLISAKNENCYSCTPCPYDSSKYKCTENVKSGYQLVNGVCSKKPEDKILTCEEWIKEKYAGYTIYNGKQSSLSTLYNAILASGSVAIPRTGVMNIVGPKYFNYEECQKLDTPTITITNTTQGLVNAYKINMIFDVDMSKNTSISAAIQPNVTSGQSMTISDASISAPGGVIRLSNFAKLLLEGNTSIKTDCHYDHSHYGCRAIDAFGNESSSTESIKVTVVTGSNVSITGALYIYSNAMLTVEKNATINITEKGRDAALFVNQSGYTPTYYARNGVHNYGILKTDSYGAHAGQVNCYSGSKFSTSKISVVSTGYPGRIKYEKQTNIKIGGTCKTPSSAGEYKFTSTITSNPISGSSCSF